MRASGNICDSTENTSFLANNNTAESSPDTSIDSNNTTINNPEYDEGQNEDEDALPLKNVTVSVQSVVSSTPEPVANTWPTQQNHSIAETEQSVSDNANSCYYFFSDEEESCVETLEQSVDENTAPVDNETSSAQSVVLSTFDPVANIQTAQQNHSIAETEQTVSDNVNSDYSSLSDEKESISEESIELSANHNILRVWKESEPSVSDISSNLESCVYNSTPDGVISLTLEAVANIHLAEHNHFVAEAKQCASHLHVKGCSVPISDEKESGPKETPGINGRKRITYSREFILQKQRTENALRRPKLLSSCNIILSSPQFNSHCRAIRIKNAQESPLRQIPKQVINIDLTPKQHRNKSANPFNLRRNRQNIDGMTEAETRKIHVQKISRMCLNKLTPEKFDSICSKNFNSDLIQSADDIRVVAEEIYAKALCDISYGALYSRLCIYIDNLRDTPLEGALTCRALIIHKCQTEFQTPKMSKIDFILWKENKNFSETEHTNNRNADLLVEYEYEMAQRRKRSLANVNFIGELYLARLLNVKPVIFIIDSLLGQQADDEKLECLVQLLTTIGKFFNQERVTEGKWYTELFRKLGDIVNSKVTSSRLRFLLVNLLDLRSNNWIERTTKEKPTTKAEIHNSIRKEDTSTCNKKYSHKSNHQMCHNKGGSSNMRSANCNCSRSSLQSRQSLNGDRRRKMRPQNLQPKMDYTYSLQRQSKVNDCINEETLTLESSPSHSSEELDDAMVELEIYRKSITSHIFVQVESIKLVKSYIYHISEEPISEKKGICQLISMLKDNVSWFVKSTLQWIIEEKEEKIAIFKNLLVDLISEKYIATNVILDQLALLMGTVEDIKMDVPMISKYMGIFLGALIASKCLRFEDITSILTPAGDAKAEIFCFAMNEVLTKMNWDEITQQITPNFDFTQIIDIRSGLALLNKHNLGNLKKYIYAADQYEYLLAPITELFKLEDNDNLYELLERECNSNTVSKKIIRALVTAFVESLIIHPSKQLPDDSIQKDSTVESMSTEPDPKLSKGVLMKIARRIRIRQAESKFVKLPKNLRVLSNSRVEALQKYICNSSELELECVYALQASATKYKHPKGFLLNLFHLLYTKGVLTADTFTTWTKNDDPEEKNGRDICIVTAGEWLKTLS